jgi:hypothetical protein
MVVTKIKQLRKENKKEELRLFKTLVYISIYPNRNPPYSFRDADNFILELCRSNTLFYNIVYMMKNCENYRLFGYVVKEMKNNILGYGYRKIK